MPSLKQPSCQVGILQKLLVPVSGYTVYTVYKDCIKEGEMEQEEKRRGKGAGGNPLLHG